MEQYFSFSGRSTRSEYWAINIVGGILAAIAILIGAAIAGTSTGAFGLAVGIMIILASFVAAIWLSVATAIRRCRDSGLNPWWAAATCIPYIGSVVFIVLGCLKTENE